MRIHSISFAVLVVLTAALAGCGHSNTAPPAALPPLSVRPAATAALTATPAKLALLGTGKISASSFTMSGGVAPYSVGVYDKTIVTVKKSKKNAAKFIVTPLKAGLAKIAMHDHAGHTITVVAGVTTLTGGVH